MADNGTADSATENELIPGDTADPAVQEVPPLPPSELYDSFDDLFNFLQAWARSNGVAFVKKSSSNPREINGTKMAAHRLILCDRGPGRPSTGRGLRRVPSQKADCPIRITASVTMKNNWRWSYRVSGAHSHPPSHHPSQHAVHRRRTADQRALALELSQQRAFPAREVAVALRERSGEPAFFHERDIYNDLQRLRSLALPQNLTTVAHNEKPSDAIATAGPASPSSAAENEGPPGQSADLEAQEVSSSLAAKDEDVPSRTADTEVSEADKVNKDNEVQEVPPLPPSELYDSFDDLFNFIQAWARSNGVAFVKKSSSNRREINGTKMAAHRLILCDRGPGRPSTGRGLRRIPSQKADCPIRITASATMKNNWRWSYRVSGAHSHPPSHHPSQHAVHRRRTADQRALALELSQQRALPAREVAVALRERSGEPAFFHERDIYNDLQRLRSLASPQVSKTTAHNEKASDAIATAGSASPSSATEDKDVSGHTADTEINEINEVQDVPPLPPSVLYDTFDDLFNFLQAWARSNGVTFVKKSSSNPREVNGTKIATRRLVLCDRGPGRPSTSRGLRCQKPSRKTDCPFRIITSATIKNNWRWSYRVSGAHNHPRSHHLSENSLPRRRPAGQRSLASKPAQRPTLPVREPAVAPRKRSGAPAFSRHRDVSNGRRRLPQFRNSKT
ncbi:hypothetical protein E4U16_007727 [Claviceps sp. LM84 group G4]|nr:hypothetical protein E4U16_007727 [Claviceps sp. LM84 group G4]